MADLFVAVNPLLNGGQQFAPAMLQAVVSPGNPNSTPVLPEVVQAVVTLPNQVPPGIQLQVEVAMYPTRMAAVAAAGISLSLVPPPGSLYAGTTATS